MALKVEIFVKNMQATDRIKEYVEKKVGKLDRFLTTIDQARVDLTFYKSARSAADRQVAQITLSGKGFTLRVEEGADDIFAAIDSSVDKMQRKIERYKGKHYRGRGDGTSVSDATTETIPAEQEPEPIIARRKQFVLVPMDEMEAIEQMSMLGQENFFVFYNANTSAINVLYKRNDGTYGLIEPKLG